VKTVFGYKKEDVISRLKKNDPIAQKMFYDQNIKKFLGVSRTYIRDIHYAEDCVIRAFCKIYKNIDSFNHSGSFEGWTRRIVVNECLNFIKTRKNVLFLDETHTEYSNSIDDCEDFLPDFDAQQLIDQLPEAYKMVFNLYVIEEYSHQEIAEILSISLSASKTQLFRAKQKLKEIYTQFNLVQNEIQ